MASERFQIPEYESPPNQYPTSVRFKEFDFGVYKFVPPPPAAQALVLDVGEQDDLQVVRFHAKERDQRGTYRWTRALSYLSLIGVPADASELVLWMDNGGRPWRPGRPRSRFSSERSPWGGSSSGQACRPYKLPIPADVAMAAAASPDAVTVRLRTVTWRPRAIPAGGR